MKIILIHIAIIILSICGFLLATYIHNKKAKKKKLVCPLRSNCETVIHSDYSKFLGIPVEVLGMLYYASIAVGYMAIYFANIPPVAPLVFFIVSLLAFIFSVYLVFIQAFVIRQWCTWCLSSALVSFLIFASSYLLNFVFK